MSKIRFERTISDHVRSTKEDDVFNRVYDSDPNPLPLPPDHEPRDWVGEGKGEGGGRVRSRLTWP